jgi:hypothetical protein
MGGLVITLLCFALLIHPFVGNYRKKGLGQTSSLDVNFYIIAACRSFLNPISFFGFLINM